MLSFPWKVVPFECDLFRRAHLLRRFQSIPTKMNSKNDTTHHQSGITGESALAIISVALAAFWITFAYYHGGNTDVNGNRILLLHPLVAIALIALLIRIYRWVGIKFVVHLEIIMIGLWIFIRMLGVFMPFILGFGFAYLFRFLWKALPLKKVYQRAIATVLIVLVCSGVLIFTGIRVGTQVGQMAQGLQKFFHEGLLPLVLGEEFQVLASDMSDGKETLLLGTDHGIYFLKNKDNDQKKAGITNSELLGKRKNKDNDQKKVGITNSELLGKRIKDITIGKKYIFAYAEDEIYRCSKAVVPNQAGKKKESQIALPEELQWTKIQTNVFDDYSIQTINAPSWDDYLIYVGTEKGLFESKDSGDNWERVKFSENRSIVSITSIEKFEEGNRKSRYIYVASTRKILDESATTGNESNENTNNSENQYKVIKEVHWRQVNSTNDWDILDLNADPVPEIQVLAASYRKGVQLYAGTANGMYQRDEAKLGNWGQMQDSAGLPQTSISLLVSTPSALYAGSKNLIYHHTTGTSAWKIFIAPKEGILKYKDEPIVKQFQEYLTQKIPGWTASGGALIKWISGLAGSIAFQFGGFLATVFLAFIVFVYASQGFEKYIHSFMSLVPERHRETAMAYLREIDRNMHQFLKGQFTVIVIVSIISCTIYRIIGVPFALLVGILAGLCNAIPTFGPFVGGGFALIAMLMGLAAGEFSSTFSFLIRCAFVLAAILGIQTIDNSVISPKVMSNAIDVDPLLIMFSVIMGASILGLWGVLLAIPIIVVIKSVHTVSQSAANGADPPPAQEQA